MSQALVNKAIQDFWCAPRQDHQFMIRPARLTPPHGTVSTVIVHNQSITLPQAGHRPMKRYSVFDIGPLAPWELNLPEVKNRWYRISDLIRTRNVDIWLYKKSGIRLPSGLGWIMRGQDNGFILAVEMDGRVPWDLNLPEEALNIRFYSNRFFRTQDFINGGYNTDLGHDYLSGWYGSELPLSQMQAWFDRYTPLQQTTPEQAKGGMYIFANGQLIWPCFNTGQIPNNSYIEMVFDRSIYRTEKILLSDCTQFMSTMDSKAKYAVVPWMRNLEENILFYDDVDFYIGRGNRAVYMHRNEPDAIRQLTNESYSVGMQHVAGHIADNPWLDGDDTYLLLRFRHAGHNQTLVNEMMHLQDMVKLGYDGFINALTGSQSNVVQWRAENIEASSYNAIQRARRIQLITPEMAYDAYGYGGATQSIHPTSLAGENTVNTGTGIVYFQTPPTFKDVTMLTFDKTGSLIRVRGGQGGNAIASPAVVGNTDSYEQHAKLIEGRYLLNATTMSYYDQMVVSNGIPVRDQGFRCYLCTRVGNGPDNQWRVVEESEGYWSVSTDGMSIEWDATAVTATNGYPAVRFGSGVVHTPQVPFQTQEDGALAFSISNTVSVGTGTAYMVEHIPYASLLVFQRDYDTNKIKLLVEGIDYYVEWPQVVVVKRYSNREISTLVYGLCNDDLTQTAVREAGFSYRGIMSVDDRWHIRNDRNIIISYGGDVLPADKVRAHENYWETQLPEWITQDTRPYMVVDVVQPLEPVIKTGLDTVEQRHIELLRVEAMEDYLSEYGPLPPIPGPNITTTKWKLYSPFLSRIIQEMIDGRFDNLPSMDELPTQLVQDMVADFVWLVDFDPITRDADLTNSIVYPHCHPQTIELQLNQCMFIARLNTMYLEGKVNLSPFLTVQGA